MRKTEPSLAIRVNRLARWQLFRSGLLVAGLVTVLLGGYTVALTLRYSPDQLIAILYEQPKSPQRFFTWFPAPSEVRVLGAALAFLGLELIIVSRLSAPRTK
jgi:hypothetical protein